MSAEPDELRELVSPEFASVVDAIGTLTDAQIEIVADDPAKAEDDLAGIGVDEDDEWLGRSDGQPAHWQGKARRGGAYGADEDADDDVGEEGWLR